MSRPAPPDRSEIVWPRFHRKGEPGPHEGDGHTRNYILFRRLLSIACGLGSLGGVGLYVCAAVRPHLFLDQGTTASIVLAALVTWLLWGISNYDTKGEGVNSWPKGVGLHSSNMTHLTRPVRIITFTLFLGLLSMHAYEQFRLRGRFIRIVDGEYALMHKRGRSAVSFVRWLSEEDFLIFNRMQLRKIGSGMMFAFLLPAVNFWFLREKLD